MKTLIVFDHPYTATACENEPHNRSFCAALCKSTIEKEALANNEIDLIDLHADGFDPVMSAADLTNWRKGIPMNSHVADYQQRVHAAQKIVFIFPVWWELMPAMTKGFIDKVYAKNILYSQPKEGPMKTLANENTLISVISVMGTPTLLYKLIFGKPMVKALQRGTFMKTGLRNFKWIPYSGVDKLTLSQRAELLEKAHA